MKNIQGNWFLTGVLEKCFGKLKTFRKQAMLHDAFEEGPDIVMRDEPLMGQISGLVLCSEADFSYEWWEKVYRNFKAEFEEVSGYIYAPPVRQSSSVGG